MKRSSRTIRTRFSAMTTPEFFADIPFNLVSQIAVAAKASLPPTAQLQLFPSTEILSFPATTLDRNNRTATAQSPCPGTPRTSAPEPLKRGMAIRAQTRSRVEKFTRPWPTVYHGLQGILGSTRSPALL